MGRKRSLTGGVIVLLVAAVGLGTYASYHHENAVTPDAHEEPLRAPRVSCAPSFLEGISGPVLTTLTGVPRRTALAWPTSRSANPPPCSRSSPSSSPP
jgi:hypothetical protein